LLLNVLKIPVRGEFNVNDFGCGFNSEKLLYPKMNMTRFTVEAATLKHYMNVEVLVQRQLYSMWERKK
jgi:hypothetical protein